MLFTRCAKLVWGSLAVLALLGCRSNPTFDTFTTLLPWGKQYAQVQPGIEYLWVSLDGRTSVMALGERKLLPGKDAFDVREYWYTGQGEMLYLLNGRIQQAHGFISEWRAQKSSAPAWAEVLQSPREWPWQRQLDIMPGYRYGVVETVTSSRVQVPKHLPEGVTSQAQWVAETISSKGHDGQEWWYLQKFAVLNDRVVYSEQCVDKSLCLKMRPLGVMVPAP